MATNLNISENQERVPLTVGSRGALRSITPDDGSPYYVGARAYVTQTAGGAVVTVIDKEGTTTATILNGTNGQNGQDGQDGADGNGIADISLTGSSANVDEYTITYDDGTTETFYVTNGIDGQDGTDGADGADGYSPTATVTKSGDTATITITDKDGTTTASISDGSGGASAFVAEFGITTYADVKDAYDDDAILICTVDDSGNQMVLQFVYFDVANEIFFFAFPTSDGVYWTELSNANGWDDGTRYFASTDVATQLRDGLMSALDWQKLDGIASGAEVNVQSDWSQSTNTADDYIKNKPTKLSQFTNDSGFITGYTETDPVFSASAASGITSADISDWNSKSEVSVTRHTTTGTNIADLTIDGTTTKLYAPTGGGGGITDVEVDGTSVVTGGVAEIDLTGKSDVGHTHTKSAITDFPTTVSSFTNDSGYITSPSVPYLTCDTAAGTAAKTTTLVAGTLPTELVTGMQVTVKFTNSNTVASPTLQVGSLTAKSIKRYGTTAPSTSAVTSWNAGNVITFVYDGTYWQMADWTTTNTTYSAITDAEYQAGTSTSSRLVTPARLKAAILYHAPSVVPTNVSDFANDAGYITGYTETDPVFTASDAYGIDSTDISNWNGKAEVSDIPTDTGDLTNGAGFLNASGILNLFYPIGSYYETSDTSFDPNVSWGGTWSLETEGQVHISAGTNYVVNGAPTDTTDGGASTVTLDSTQIPSHTHQAYADTNYKFVVTNASMYVQNDKRLAPTNGSGTYYMMTASSSHTVVGGNTTLATGGGGAHNNMQPYIIVNRWHRTA